MWTWIPLIILKLISLLASAGRAFLRLRREWMSSKSIKSCFHTVMSFSTVQYLRSSCSNSLNCRLLQQYPDSHHFVIYYYFRSGIEQIISEGCFEHLPCRRHLSPGFEEGQMHKPQVGSKILGCILIMTKIQWGQNSLIYHCVCFQLLNVDTRDTLS